MGAWTFLFPGQGSQAVGMGAELLRMAGTPLELYLLHADAASAAPVSRYCLDGPSEVLVRTEIAQPAVLAVSLALADAARDRGFEPELVAGHSLGEWTAAIVSGAIGRRDGIELVALRGRLMAEAQRSRPGSMAAVAGLSGDEVRELCFQVADYGTVVPANFNAPDQIVVSGDREAVEHLVSVVGEGSGSRATTLPVGAAFHSPLMEPVGDRLAEAIRGARWRDPEVPVCVSAGAAIARTGEELCEALVNQVTAPVRWRDCVGRLWQEGALRFLELGPGNTLERLVRACLPDAHVVAANGLSALNRLRPSTR